MSYSKTTKMKYKAGDTIRFLDTPNIQRFVKLGKERECRGLTYILTEDEAKQLNNRSWSLLFGGNKWQINFVEGDFELISETKITNDYELY